MRIILFFGLVLVYSMLQAQPDESYKSQLTSEINDRWVISTGSSIPNKTLRWNKKKAPGFQKVGNLREQAVLSQPWHFYSVDTMGQTASAKMVELPHDFEENRSYKSGWYFSKYALDKKKEKRYVVLFDRVQTFSVLFVNGKRIGDHFGGHTPFEHDITDAIVKGQNTLAIFVHDQSASVDGDKAYGQLGTTRLISVYNKNPTKDFPGGIKDVPLLEVREKNYVKDIFIKTSTRKNEMEIEYELAGEGPSSNSMLSFQLLKWPEGEKVDLEIRTIKIQKASDTIGLTKTIWQHPELWSPDQPNLYVLRTTLKSDQSVDIIDTRFGFREFWIEGKSFMLNGKPIKLRGESYYGYPEVTDATFHREVFNMQKELFKVNANRLHAFMPPKEVVTGADEAGILLDNQSAIWSENASYYKKGGDWFLKNMERDFQEWARRDRNSPSVVIWDVENEMLRISYEEHLNWVKKLDGFIKKVDSTRPFNNSGQGWVGPDQDMVLLHMQEHYSKIMSDWNEKGTKPLIMGEFWVGGRAEQRLPNAPELVSAEQRFVEEAKIYEEQMLEMRYRKVSGIMPFRISTLSIPDYRNISSYKFSPPDSLKVNTRSKAVLNRLRHGLEPITIFFWPRRNYAVYGQPEDMELVVANDSENEETLEVVWKWDNKKGGTQKMTLPPAGQERIRLDEAVPSGATKLMATVRNNTKLVSSDTIAIHPVTLPKIKPSQTLQVYKDQKLAKTLSDMGYKTILRDNVPRTKDNVLWIIPERANNRELNSIKDSIHNYLNTGGKLLSLEQNQAPTWFPVKLDFWSANQTSPHTYAGMGWEGLNKHLFFATVAPIYASCHPIFKGIDNKSLSVWDTFDGRVSDDVFSRPSSVNRFEKGNWLPLAGGTRREHISLAELYHGKGRMLTCQLHIMDNLDNVQAKALLINMLNYLSDIDANEFNAKVEVRGDLDPHDIADLTGASRQKLGGAAAEDHDLMLAFPGTDMEEIKNWADKGGQVMVFSKDGAEQYDNVEVKYEGDKLYYTTKIDDIPLLHGVSSFNFLDMERSATKGFFSKYPEESRVLLQGFSSSKKNAKANLTDLWDIEEAGPVMVSMPYGAGNIILSTLQIDKEANPSTREFLSHVLTNAGINIPFGSSKSGTIAIKKTVPIEMDGKLNEWLEDMEDRYVTQYIHAEPVYLTSESIIEGPPEFDLNLSAINYLLWDENALYVSGVVFSEEKTFEAGVSLGGSKKYVLRMRYNHDLIEIFMEDGEAWVELNGTILENLRLGIGQLESKNSTDASRLQFNYIQKSGKIASLENLVGETFELEIPWDKLKSSLSDKNPKVLFTLTSGESKIQVPLTADEHSQDKWLTMKLETSE